MASITKKLTNLEMNLVLRKQLLLLTSLFCTASFAGFAPIKFRPDQTTATKIPHPEPIPSTCSATQDKLLPAHPEPVEGSSGINSPRFLIKIPTRSRPEQFFTTLDAYYKALSGKIPYHFLISLDQDDVTMNNATVIDKLNRYPNLSFYFGENPSKVAAYNADLDKYTDWDFMLVTSDDAVPAIANYDAVLAEIMQTNFPDYDGVINFHDGAVNDRCNTLPVMGKKYYDRFGYIYHPDYTALCCDVELTEVSKILKKEVYVNGVIIRHNHPVWGWGQWDELYEYNQKFDKEDQRVYEERKSQNFMLPKNS